MTISRDAILSWIRHFATVTEQQKDYLTQLDSAIGDADHGVNLHRGMQTVLIKLPEMVDKDIGSILRMVGMTLIATVGGASGPLYGTFFMRMGNATANKLELTLVDWTNALDAATQGVIMRGGAAVGDKTMIDALAPALYALRESNIQGLSPAMALLLSAQTAERGRDSTFALMARKGRASYLGERSAGHLDPGATSTHLLLKAAADTLII